MESKKQKVFTGHYDVNNKPIYLGDTIKEGCNGLISKVEFNKKRGAYWLEGLGEGYGIEDSEIEWEVLDIWVNIIGILKLNYR